MFFFSPLLVRNCKNLVESGCAVGAPIKCSPRLSGKLAKQLIGESLRTHRHKAFYKAGIQSSPRVDRGRLSIEFI